VRPSLLFTGSRQATMHGLPPVQLAVEMHAVHLMGLMRRMLAAVTAHTRSDQPLHIPEALRHHAARSTLLSGMHLHRPCARQAAVVLPWVGHRCWLNIHGQQPTAHLLPHMRLMCLLLSNNRLQDAVESQKLTGAVKVCASETFLPPPSRRTNASSQDYSHPMKPETGWVLASEQSMPTMRSRAVPQGGKSPTLSVEAL